MKNLKKEGNKISYEQKESMDEQELMDRYETLITSKKFLEAQKGQIPRQKKQAKQNIELKEGYIEKAETRIEKIKEILDDLGLDPEDELEKIRDKYSEEELNKKERNLYLNKEKTKIRKSGKNYIKRTTVEMDKEELLVEYASLKFRVLKYKEQLAKEKRNLKKAKEQEEKLGKMIENNKEEVKAFDKYLQRQGKDIAKIKNSINKKKTAKELPNPADG